MNADVDAGPPQGAELLTLAEAAKLSPRPRPGRRRSVGMIARWVKKGRLRAWKVAGRLVVARAEVTALLRSLPRDLS